MGHHSSDLSFHQAMLINCLGVCCLLDYFRNQYGTRTHVLLCTWLMLCIELCPPEVNTLKP